ncbi:MAG: hypothetical protein ACP5U2_09740 [Bryobacteraceae bacterium]
MSSESLTLPAAYGDPAVQAFGKALRAALSFEEDYASLMDFENAETPEAFAEAIKRFLRRNYKSGVKPSASELERVMAMARTAQDVRLLRAAIVSYGLVRWDKKEDKEVSE